MSDAMRQNGEPPVRIGGVLAGKYRVERVIGVGGMGVVAAATHIELNQRVAIKFLLPAYAQNGESAARFLREARAAVALTSEHAVRVHDVGRLESGSPYMVMEYLEGRDLAEVLREEGALPPSLCVDYMLQVIDALAEAHALGIIHRDLKPSNLFLARRGRGHRVKVLDFGISKLSTDAQNGFSLTQSNSILGSPYYMAPEQMRSTRTVDQRADIWSLGVILYELSTGKLPFAGETLAELCLQISQDAPPSVRTIRVELPIELETIVSRCLEKSPERRYANVGELAEALEHTKGILPRLGSDPALRPSFVSHDPLAETTPQLTPPPSAPSPSAPSPSSRRGQDALTAPGLTTEGVVTRREGTSRWLLVALALVGITAMVGGALAVRRRAHVAPDHRATAAVATAETASMTPPAPTPIAAPTPSAAPTLSAAPTPTLGEATTPSAAPATAAVAPAASASASAKGIRPPTVRTTAAPPKASAKTPEPPSPTPPAKQENGGFSMDRR